MTYKSDATTLQCPGRSNFSLKVSPRTPALPEVCSFSCWCQCSCCGEKPGALRRLAETRVSSFQDACCKLLCFPNWDAGSLAPPSSQRLTLRSPCWEEGMCHGGQSGAPGSIMLVSASVSEDWSPQAPGDQLLSAFRCKITVCNLNSSWLQWALPEGLSSCRVLVLWTRTSRRYQEHQGWGCQPGSQSWGSQVTTHTLCRWWHKSAEEHWPRGWQTQVICRVEREIRQEQQDRSKVSSWRKFYFSLLTGESSGQRGKGQGWELVLSSGIKRDVECKVGFHFQLGSSSLCLKALPWLRTRISPVKTRAGH